MGGYKTRTNYQPPHPADRPGLEYEVPDFKDNTDWILPEHSEYYQIRKKIRQEQELLVRNEFRAKYEDLVRLRTTAKTFVDADASPLARPSSPLVSTDPVLEDAARLSDFGDDDVGARKAQRVRELTMWPGDEADDPETPPEVLRKLRHVHEYTGIRNPEDLVAEVRRISRHSLHGEPGEKQFRIEQLQKSQKAHIERFDKHAEKLIEETSALRERIAQDEKALDEPQVQESLRKWYLLKIDFASSEEARAALVVQMEQLGVPQILEQKMTSAIPLEEVIAEPVSSDGKSSTTEADTAKARAVAAIKKSLQPLTTLHISLEMAQSLLDDDSVLALVEDMKKMIEEVHKSLHHDDKDYSTSFIREYDLQHYWKGKLNAMKSNRALDRSVFVKLQFKDSLVNRLTRLRRTAYDRFAKELDQARDNHAKLVPWSKADFGLENVGPIKLSVKHQYYALQTQDDSTKDYVRKKERYAELKVKLEDLNLSDVEMKALRELALPDQLQTQPGHLVMVCGELPTQEQNERRAVEVFAKFLREVRLFAKVHDAGTWEEYQERTADPALLDSIEPKIPSIPQFRAEQFYTGREKTIDSDSIEAFQPFVEGAIESALAEAEMDGSKSAAEIFSQWANEVGNANTSLRGMLNVAADVLAKQTSASSRAAPSASS